MSLTTIVKELLNAALRPANLRIETLVAEQRERQRLQDHATKFGFEEPLYSLSPGMAEFDPASIADDYALHQEAIERLKNKKSNDTGFEPGNTYYKSPDLEVLYLFVRRYVPATIVEIGCGNSTKITRQAIIDGKLPTKIVAVDPQPRTDIANLIDRFEQGRVETLADTQLFSALKPNDILFIDSSHELRAGNDCAHLFCRIIPTLQPGVIVHVHDIFIPYEYPAPFFFDFPGWSEQYLLHALLQGGSYEILWPGQYLQRARPQAFARLPFLTEGSAQSFWIRKKA